jgi:ABC-2 type transport system permease protein
MALYTLVIVALYPAFKHTTSLDKLATDNPAVAALLGVVGSLTSPGGWLNANIYEYFLPLVLLLSTVGYGAAALAGHDEDGTLGLVVSLPVRRATVVGEKALAMGIQAMAIAVAVAVCVELGRFFDVTAGVGHVLTVTLATVLLGLDYGLVALAVGAATGRRSTAIGAASALAAASYLVSSLAPVVAWIRPARFLSLFYWAVGNDQIANGVSLADYAVLLGVGIIALGVGALAFERLDLH